MNERGGLPTTGAILLGLVVAQIIASLQVYHSNVDLYRTLAAIGNAGYLVVPNAKVMAGLRGAGPAFFGGLFFTLSIGAGLSVIAIAGAWIWDRVCRRNRSAMATFLVCWVVAIAAVNSNGFALFDTLYFVAVPPAVFIFMVKRMSPQQGVKVLRWEAIHLIPIALLAVLWLPQIGKGAFLDVRDNLLFSNAIGTGLSDSYYRYTLYPAQAFKSFEQKQLKTCRLHDEEVHPVKASPIERVLLRFDYLPVGGDGPVDLDLIVEGEKLRFEHDGRFVFTKTDKEFLTSPLEDLKEYSHRVDRHRFLRRATYWSLILGSPILLYLLLYGFFRRVALLLLSLRATSILASCCCLAVGLGLLLLSFSGGAAVSSKADIGRVLETSSWRNRVQALRAIRQQGLDVSRYPQYTAMLTSPHIPERYWLVRALAASRNRKTYDDLLHFLDDPNQNVVYVTYYVLGQRGDRRAVGEIIKRINDSERWYNQLYAYQALRALGWMQKK